MEGEQIGSGDWGNPNYGLAVYKKIDAILRTTDWSSEETILYCDADVLFVKPTKEFLLKQLGGYEMAFQYDDGYCNTGFFVYRTIPKVKRLLERTLECAPKGNDQYALNDIIHSSGINYRLFSSSIWNISFLCGQEVWDGTTPIPFPPKMKIFHATWIGNCALKEKALQAAKDQFLS